MPRRILALAVATIACADDGPAADGPTTGTTGDGTTTSSGPSTSTSTTRAESSSSTTTDAESSTSTGDAPPPPLQWSEDCTVGATNLGVLHPDLQCTSIEVPLDWDDPDGESIVVAALRVPTSVAPRRGQMWMLDGGPGGSGLAFFGDAALVDAITSAGWDYVVPSHRGTLSPALSCDPWPPLSTECRARLEEEWGDGLRHFDTLSAARDLGELVARTQAELAERTIVYGVSYGSYWAQFYAGELPTQADGIVLDSVLPADADIGVEELIVQQRAEDLLQACVDDPTCGPRVGFASGADFSAAVIAAIDEGDCGGLDFGRWEDTSYRSDLGALINTHRARNFVPLLAAMLVRCDPELAQLAASSFGAIMTASFGQRSIDGLPFGTAGFGGVPYELYLSPTLQALVMGTTMLRPDGDPEAAALASERHFATLGFGRWVADTDAAWGDLPDVAFDRAFVAEVPLLILNSRYDLQTVLPWAEDLATHHRRPLHAFADGQHALAFTGTGGKYPDGSPCARRLLLEFAADPPADLDATCVDELPAIDPNLQRADLQEISSTVFGTSDPWSLVP